MESFNPPKYLETGGIACNIIKTEGSEESEGGGKVEDVFQLELYYRMGMDGIPSILRLTLESAEAKALPSGSNGHLSDLLSATTTVGTCDLLLEIPSSNLKRLKPGGYLDATRGNNFTSSAWKAEADKHALKWEGFFHRTPDTDGTDSFEVVLFLTARFHLRSLLQCQGSKGEENLVKEYKKSLGPKGNSLYHYGEDAVNLSHLPWVYSGSWKLNAASNDANNDDNTEIAIKKNFYFEVYRGKKGLNSMVLDLPSSFALYRKGVGAAEESGDGAAPRTDVDVAGYALEQPQPLCTRYGKVAYSVRTWVASYPNRIGHRGIYDVEHGVYEAVKLSEATVSPSMNEHFDIYEVDSEYNCKIALESEQRQLKPSPPPLGAGGDGDFNHRARDKWWCYQDWMVEGVSESTYPPFLSQIRLAWTAVVTTDLDPPPSMERSSSERPRHQTGGAGGGVDEEIKRRSATGDGGGGNNDKDTFAIVLNTGFYDNPCDSGDHNIISSGAEIEGRIVLYTDSKYETEYEPSNGADKLTDGSRVYAALKLSLRSQHCPLFVAVIEKVEVSFPVIEAFEDGSVAEKGIFTETIYDRSTSTLGSGDDDDDDNGDAETEYTDYDVRIETEEDTLCVPKISWLALQKAPPGRKSTLSFVWSIYYLPKSSFSGGTDVATSAEVKEMLDVPTKTSTTPTNLRKGTTGASVVSILEKYDSSRPEERYKVENSVKSVSAIDEVKYAAYRLKNTGQDVDVSIACKRGTSWLLRLGSCVDASALRASGEGGGGGGGPGWGGNGYGRDYWVDRNGVEVVFPGLRGHWDQWWWMWAVFFIIFIVIVALLLWCACYDGWGYDGGGRKHNHHHHHRKDKINQTTSTTSNTTITPEALGQYRQIMQGSTTLMSQQQQQPTAPTKPRPFIPTYSPWSSPTSTTGAAPYTSNVNVNDRIKND